jgi:hypothetical protein
MDGDSGHDHGLGMYEVRYLHLKGKKNTADKLGHKEGKSKREEKACKLAGKKIEVLGRK